MLFILFFILFLCPGLMGSHVLDKHYWEKSSLEDLKNSLNTKYNKKVAKNVILFIGDGMGQNTATAARIYSQGETGYLSWEKFPHVGILKTYSNDKQVSDSASTGTAMFSGVKTNYGTVGVDSTVKRFDCNASALEENQLVTVATLAQRAGKATGIVTTARITHATPSAMYAHSPDRDWECDTKIPNHATQCKDIARQLIEDVPGKNFNVIMGGGRQQLITNSSSTTGDPVNRESYTCTRLDGRDLIAEWARGKELQRKRYALPRNIKELLEVDTKNTDYLLGIFQNDHFPFAYSKDNSEKGVPSLEQMTTTAVKVLMNNKNGFFLMVESALVDQAHHIGKVRIALSEVLELNKAVNSSMKLLQSAGIQEETLVIVTSDHSHTLSISGYPDIGSNILGLAGKSTMDGKAYTTLSYANGAKSNYHYIAVNGSVVREDPSNVDTTSFDYGHQAAVHLLQNSHGGSDVLVYAAGPYAHLFHNMHEQNYVAQVIKFASRTGDHSTTHRAKHFRSSEASNLVPCVAFLVLIQQLLYFLM